jgi:TP901 family phage tail tape measure protein
VRVADRTIRTYLRVEAADAKRELRSIAAEADKAGAAFDASGKRIETASGRLVRSARVNASEWRTVGTTLATLGTVGIAALGASAAAAISWESAWTGVLKTVDGTNAQLSTLEEGLRRMATELPSTHTEIAAVAEAAGQLGVGVEDVQAFTRTMIDLGETTNLSAEEAATGLARFANVMGTAQSDVQRLGSTIVGLGNNFATTEREILDMAQRLSAAGAVVGMSEADVLGLSAAMSSVGIEAEAGGSAISRVMIAITKAVDSGGEKFEAFARAAKMSSEDFADAWRDDSASALLAVVGGLSEMTEAGEGAFGMLDELGLKDVRVTNALLSMANAAEMTGRAIEQANVEWDENTALLEEANKRYETTEARIKMARNAMNDAAIEIGGNLLPVVANLADGVAGVAQWFANLPDPVQRAAASIGGFASAGALAAGGLAMMVPKAVEMYDAMQRLRVVSPRAATAIAGVGKAAGIAAGAVGIGALVDALVNLADGAGRGVASSEEMMAAILELDAAMPADMFASFKNVDSITEALDAITGNGGVSRQLDLWASKLDDVFGTSIVSSVQDSKRAFAEWGVVLARLVEMDRADLANQGLELLYGQVDQTRYSIEDLKAAMPAYTDALAAVENQTKLTADETEGFQLKAKTVVDEMERWLTFIGMTAEGLAEWQTAAANASGSFVDLAGAYDSVIDKNRQVAQSTADATESAKDSWEDYYDGVTVNIKDFIKGLEDQVAAQEAWEDNMLSLAGRVSDEMIEYLMGLGEQGSPLVAMLSNAKDSDLAKIEALYSEAGVLATSSFAQELTEATFGEIPVEVDTTPAIAEIDEFMRMYNGTSIYMNVKPRVEAGESNWSPTPTSPTPGGSSGGGGGWSAPNPLWGGAPTPTPLTPQAQTNTFGAVHQPPTPIVLREHTTEQTSVFIDKLVAEDVDDFTQQATALKRGAAVAGMRAM